jgi:hypothetical protein
METIVLDDLQIEYVRSVIEETPYLAAMKDIKPNIPFELSDDDFYEINNMLGLNEALLINLIDDEKTIEGKQKAEDRLDFATKAFNVFQNLIRRGRR